MKMYGGVEVVHVYLILTLDCLQSSFYPQGKKSLVPAGLEAGCVPVPACML